MTKKNYDDIISRIIVEIDVEQAEYQRLYKNLYGESDEGAKRIYSAMIEVCSRIRGELKKERR